MHRLALSNDNKGFTLIEFVVAVLIMTVGILALLQVIGNCIAQNASNKMRNDAILLADQVMTIQKSRVFAQISSTRIRTKISDNSFVNYSVTKSVTDMATASKDVKVDISWRDHNAKKTHSLRTVITNQ